MKKVNKILALFLAFILVFNFIPVNADEENTSKEEVVYISLNDDGTVDEINVVNIFELKEDGRIVDYGDYQNVRNMTTTDNININDDKITINSKKGKLYYEGKIENKEIPWKISLKYYLDGKEYEAADLAGKSGKLKIIGSIKENTKCEGDFFEGYALMITLTLDTDNCKNIVAEDATIANVGSSKQLSYTILPNKETDFEITADVSDFEFNGISINGIPLNLNIEVDDEEIMDQINDLIEAIEKLDDGAIELNDGVSELESEVKSNLQSGTNELNDGVNELYDGTAKLKDGGNDLNNGALELQKGVNSFDEGINSLNDGVEKMQLALVALNSKSADLTDGSAAILEALSQLNAALSSIEMDSDELTKLVEASASIYKAIEQLNGGLATLNDSVNVTAYENVMLANGLDVEALYQANSNTITSLTSNIEALKQQVAMMKENGMDTTEVEAQISQLASIVELLTANNANIDGTKAYLTSVNSSINTLYSGCSNLFTNYAYFDKQINDLVTTLTDLVSDLEQLSNSVSLLLAEYEKLDDGINEYTAALDEIVKGYGLIYNGSKELVEGSSDLKSGADDLYGGTEELLSAIVEIYNGTGTLKDGTGSLDEGVAELLTAIAKLYDGTKELSDGTSEIKDETADMDDEITDKIDELISSITGEDMELTSFVSAKNTNIEMVQFVMQTPAISIEEVETVEKEAEKLSFIDKLLNLFRN